MSEEKLDLSISPEQEAFIAERQRQYIINGTPPIEAAQMAASDWEESQKEMSEEQMAAWNKITKEIGLDDFFKDFLIRTLSDYKETFNKENPDRGLDFNLKLLSKGLDNKRLIASASLELQIRIDGTWSLWRKKEINFQHVREMREGHRWKLALYEAMMSELIGWGINTCIRFDDIRTGRIKVNKTV